MDCIPADQLLVGPVSAKDFPSLIVAVDWRLQCLKYSWPWLARWSAMRSRRVSGRRLTVVGTVLIILSTQMITYIWVAVFSSNHNNNNNTREYRIIPNNLDFNNALYHARGRPVKKKDLSEEPAEQGLDGCDRFNCATERWVSLAYY